DERAFMKINYGPWDRLAADKAFIDGVGEKPLGANFYPVDMTKAEFEAFDDPSKTSLYTLIRRDDKGKLMSVPYHKAFSEQVWKVADILNANVAVLAEQEDLKKYLKARAEALLTDDYQASDIAWLEMEDNGIDVIIGPIENYEDKLYGYKAAHEAYILVKDKEWTERLKRFATFLPELQAGLPVPAEYKKETPGRDSQLGAYDVVYYAGDCNAGSKTIAVNLPNDESVQLSHGTRRLQFKNAMRAKFDKILLPLSDVLIAEDQRKHITFDAFFGNTMFHEVAHGLGIKETITGKGSVREALKELHSALEEGKADVLGLYMV
ncbi:MAG: Zn-dependent hydrolase, partial [Bacteroidota bacterium]